MKIISQVARFRQRVIIVNDKIFCACKLYLSLEYFAQNNSSTKTNVVYYNWNLNIKLTVTAEEKSCTAISLDKTAAEIAVGETVKLTATAAPADTTDTITWKSSDTAVAAVEVGTVKGVKEGTAKITVTCGEKSAECEVTVKAAEVSCTAVKLDKTTATVGVGKTVALTATVEPVGTTDKVTWISDDTKIATVDANGVVTGVAEGTAKITVSCGKRNAVCTVTVEKVIPISDSVIGSEPGKESSAQTPDNAAGVHIDVGVKILAKADVEKYQEFKVSVTITLADGTKYKTKQDYVVSTVYQMIDFTGSKFDYLGNIGGYALVVPVKNVPKGATVEYTFTDVPVA